VSETAGNVAAMMVKLDKLQVDVAQQAVKLEAASHEIRREIRDMQSKQDRDLRSILRHLEGGHHHVDQRPLRHHVPASHLHSEE
jgi:hypothetical protein